MVWEAAGPRYCSGSGACCWGSTRLNQHEISGIGMIGTGSVRESEIKKTAVLVNLVCVSWPRASPELAGVCSVHHL